MSVDFQLINKNECGVPHCWVPCRHVAVRQCLYLYIACLDWLELYLVAVDIVLIFSCKVGVCLVEDVGKILAVIRNGYGNTQYVEYPVALVDA